MTSRQSRMTTLIAFAGISLNSIAQESKLPQNEEGWWQQVTASIAGSEYEIRGGAAEFAQSTFHAVNRTQNLRAEFSATGITITPRLEQEATWSIGLSLIGLEQYGAPIPAAAAERKVNDRTVTYFRGDIVESYTNEKSGILLNIDLSGSATINENTALAFQLNTDLEAVIGDNGKQIDFYSNGIRVARMSILASPGRGGGPPKAVLAGDKLLLIAPKATGTLATIQMAVTAAANQDTQVGPSLTPDWVLETEQDTADFGVVIAPAGDVDGDGFSDVIVGAPKFDVGQAAGRVFLYRGSNSGLATVPDWSADGEASFGEFGSSIASAGRVNNDEYSDIIVGAPGADRVYIYPGSPTGLLESPYILYGDEGTRFGASVASAGDVDADPMGLDDVIVGAPHKGGGESVVFFAPFDNAPIASTCLSVPRSCLEYNGNTGNDENTIKCTPIENDGAKFGFSVASAGFVDSDNKSDIIIGAPSFKHRENASSCSNLFTGAGAAFVYRGSTIVDGRGGSCLDATDWCSIRRADFDYPGSGDGAEFGFSVAGAGDVNGDGADDVIVGAPLFRHSGNCDSCRGDDNVGAAIVFLAIEPEEDNGQLLDKREVLETNGEVSTGPWIVRGAAVDGGPSLAEAARFGETVASAGDVNGDGLGDVVVGGLGVETRGTANGVALVILGTRDRFPLLGIDEYRDLYGGAEGAQPDVAFPNAADWLVTGEMEASRLGQSVATAGDVDGDGFTDLLIGSRDQAFVYRGSGFGPDPCPENNCRPDADLDGEDSDLLGYSVSSAGDVNGDGFMDAIVGAPGSGEAFVYFGPDIERSFLPEGIPETPDWELTEGGAFGRSVAKAGDINGDGYGDVIVGDPTHNNGRGKVFVYLGSEPPTAQPGDSWTMEGAVDGAEFGTAVANAGDVNGDGYGDVVVGAPGVNSAFVYLGSPVGLSTSPLEFNGVSGRFGHSVGSAGDVNADGYSDLVVGAPDFADSGDVGAAYVYLGSLSNPLSTMVWEAKGGQSGGGFGTSVASAGDVNGDGFGDLIIGAPNSDTELNVAGNETDEGRVFVYLGGASGLDQLPTWTGVGLRSNGLFGRSAASAGDVNGDGLSDVIIGTVGDSFLYFGSSSGMSSTPAWSPECVSVSRLPCISYYSLLGDVTVPVAVAVAGLGDVNGDGFDDVILGHPRPGFPVDVGIYLGNRTTGVDRRPRQLGTDNMPIAPLGASDSESQFKIQVQRPNGSGSFDLEWEVKPLGVPFDGQNLERGADIFTDPGRITATVSGLTAATPYRWRARIVTDSPFAPRTPWFSSPGGSTGASLITAGVRSAPAFAAIGPEQNVPVFADSPPIDFLWHAGESNSFELQWSSDGAFADTLITSGDIPANGTDFVLFTPDSDLWRRALALAQSPDFREAPLFWRIVSGNSASESEIRTIRIAANERPTVYSPAEGESVDDAPTLMWKTNHNDAYQVRFSANSFIGEPRIVVGDSEGTGDSTEDYNITASACPETQDFCFDVPAAIWDDVKSLGEIGSDGRSTVYYAVFAKDALNRASFSETRSLKIQNPGTPAPQPPSARKSGGGPIGLFFLTILALLGLVRYTARQQTDRTPFSK